MVQFFVGPQSQQSLDAQVLGQGFGQGIGNIAQRGLLQNYLDQAQKQAVNAQSPLQQAFALMKAGAAIPGSEKYLSTLLPLLLQQTQNQNLAKADLGGRTPQESPAQRQALPGFMQKPGQQAQLGQQKENAFYPNIIGGQEDIGNLPLPSTQKVPQPIMSGDELAKSAQELSKQVPGLTYDKAFEIQSSKNQANKDYNATIKVEQEATKSAQRDYGKIAEEKLGNVGISSNDEITAIGKKWAEEAAGKSQSEAQIEREIAAKSAQLKNTIANLKRTVPAPRTQNILGRSLSGQTQSFEQTKQDVRAKLQPLLKEGLYDTARSLLSERGYYPEEREAILSDLNENVSKQIAQMPKIPSKSTELALKKHGKSAQQKENIQREFEQSNSKYVSQFENNLSQVLQADPKANLILLRRQYEFDKNVDWRLFKDGLNKLIDSGQWQPDDDQFKQLDLLEGPPVAPLNKLLHGLNLIGR